MPRWRRCRLEKLTDGGVSPPSWHIANRHQAKTFMLNRTATLYYTLAIAGLAATWCFNWQFFAGGGSIAPDSFWPAAFANPLSTAITIGVYWAALVFSLWAILKRVHAGSPQGLCTRPSYRLNSGNAPHD
jgi:hypothetical protein